MTFHSDDHASREDYDRREPFVLLAIEPVSDDHVAPDDHAQQRLPERAAPPAHRPQIPRARRSRHPRMRVQEPDDVASLLLALHHPRVVKRHARRPTRRVSHATRMPDAPAPLADEHPAFLVRVGLQRLHRRFFCSRSTPTRLARSKCRSPPDRQMPAVTTVRSFFRTTLVCRRPSTVYVTVIWSFRSA